MPVPYECRPRMPPEPYSLTTFLLTSSATSAKESSLRVTDGANSVARTKATGMSRSRLTGVFLGAVYGRGAGRRAAPRESPPPVSGGAGRSLQLGAGQVEVGVLLVL